MAMSAASDLMLYLKALFSHLLKKSDQSAAVLVLAQAHFL